MLRYFTAGESHGKQLTVIIEGIPAGLKIDITDIDKELLRRRCGYGRGERVQKIEKDSVEIMSGIRLGETIGSPITLVIKNADWENWKDIMAYEYKSIDKSLLQFRPRPGHADLSGIIKFNRKDIRDILERASARETAARVAAGAIFKKFLSEFGIKVYSFVKEIGGIKASLDNFSGDKLIPIIEKSPLRTPDKSAEKEMMRHIDNAKNNGDTVGGIFTVIAAGVFTGLGNHTQWDLKLDGNIAKSLMSIQAIKGVEFGLGFEFGSRKGSKSHDEIFYSAKKGFYRVTNNAGGIEGGITNGQDIVVNCVMKPIPSLMKPLRSVNINTKKIDIAEAVRSDVCAVPAAGIVGEAVVSYEISSAIKEKFGGDSMKEIKTNVNSYLKQINKAEGV